MAERMTAVILAGGESRRMGSDKANLSLAGGTTFLQRTAALAAGVCDEVIIVGRARPSDWPFGNTVFLPDETPGLGPAGGILTALRHTPDAVLAVACDMPALTADALRWLRDASAAYRYAPGVVGIRGDDVEPLFAVYRPACLSPLEIRLAAGRRSLQGLIAALPFALVEVPAAHRPALRNVNTPEDLNELGAPAVDDAGKKESPA